MKAFDDAPKILPERGPYRVIYKLDQTQHAPKASENFRSLCTGERGVGVGGKKLHYKGLTIDYVLPKFCIQMGLKNEHSCFGQYLEDEKLHIKGVSFSESGILCAGNHGPNTISTTFMVTLLPCTHLDGYNQIL